MSLVRSSSSEQLNIKVKDADGNEVFFKVKKHTRLAKLKRAYAERMGRPENAVRFITADGSRIGDDDTAETVSIWSGEWGAGLLHGHVARMGKWLTGLPVPP